MLDHNTYEPQFPQIDSIGMFGFILDGSDCNIECILQY